MAVRSTFAHVVRGSVVLTAVAAVATMLFQAQSWDWVELILLAILACAASQLKLKLPGTPQTVSLAILPIAAAITSQPSLVVFVAASSALLFDWLLERRKGRAASQLVLELAGAAIATLGACSVFRYAQDTLGLGLFLALSFAVAAYFAASSGVGATLLGLECDVSPWTVWKGNHFWTVPLYLLAPVAVIAGRVILQSAGLIEVASGLFAACFVGLYLKIYFSRLSERESRAQAADKTQQLAIETLAEAIDTKDGTSAGHLQRVKKHARMLAEALGCPEPDIRTLELAAVLHDVGKVGVPDYILRKPSRLTQHEFSAIANHAAIGAEIISRAKFPQPVEQIVLAHHEHWDGSGYPRGVKGEQIPLLARILTLVDCFNALLTDRPYREAMSIEQAVEVLREERGKMFDPRVVDAFLVSVPRFREQLRGELEAERRLASEAVASMEQFQQDDAAGGDARDQSIRRHALQRLALIPDQLVAFYDILSNLGADLNFDKSIKECLTIVRRIVPYDKAGIFVLEQGQYVLLQADGLPDHCLSRLALPAEHGVVAQAAATRLPVVADAPPSELVDGRVPRYLDDLQSSVVTPLVIDDEVVGVLVLGSLEPGSFTQQHGEFLSLITPKLATSVMSSRALQKVYLEAETDEMTSLPNARAAFRKLESELQRADRQGQTVAVLYMDLDGLKPVNDSYGHSAGDKLLLDIGRNLRAHLRSYDFLGRVGGDEFLAIVPGIAKDGLDAKVLAIKKTLASKPIMVTEGVYLRPKMSVGAALFPVDATESEELIYLADRRMYRDKTHSRSGPQFERVASSRVS
jgi:diguanylate cyclase (GGDEF)-like protein/putative nucleotidyltransferase with HDIG domain